MNVKTADRTLDLFEAFAELRRPATLSDIAAALDIPISSCFALVRTIEARGYLYPLRERGPLYPTGRLLQVAQTIAAHDPVTARVGERLSALRDASGETVVIGAIRQAGVVYLDVFESRQAIRYSPRPGEVRPIHANSIGKAVLGAMAPRERAAVLGRIGYERFTPQTLVTAEVLEDDLRRSTERGWFLNDGESVADLVAISCPVRINSDIFGVSIAGPAHRVRVAAETLVPLLRGVCEAISDQPGSRTREPIRSAAPDADGLDTFTARGAT